MSCVTRCPRKNAPGLIVMALRNLSIELGYFVESEKGRQQCLLTKDLCSNILDYGYCVYPRRFDYAAHPEAGKVWEWEENIWMTYSKDLAETWTEKVREP